MKQIMQPVSIVVPTLNEEGNIALLFKRIHIALSHVGIPYEIIVVDDHSTDKTAELVEQAHPKYNARLLYKQGKPGKAFSLLEGFAAANYELVCMIDGDLQYPPEAIKLMYHKLQYCEADIVLTERVDNKTSLLRRLSSSVFNILFTRTLFGINYDTQSGLKLFRKSILKTIQIEPSPWTFDLEFIVKALEQNYVIVSQQIPFSQRNAGVPKVRILSATAEIASGSLKLWRKTSTKRVRLGYQQSEIIKNSIYGVTVAAISALFLVVTPPSATYAQTRGVLDPTFHNAQELFPDNNTTSPTPVLTPPPTEQPQSSQPVLAPEQSQPQSAPAATQTPSSAASMQSTAKLSSSVPALPRTVNTNQQQPSVKLAYVAPNAKASDPNSFKNAEGSNATYYPISSLGKARTASLHKVALNVVVAGGIFIGLSVLVIAFKLFTTRIRHQPLRT